MRVLRDIFAVVRGDKSADRVVPPSGFTAQLVLFSSAAMAFLTVFALALSLATGRLAERWSSELARSATIRISAPTAQIETQVQAALRVLETTPGIAEFRALGEDEQRALLEPWFGPQLPLETLPIPRMIEVVEDADGFDAEGLKLRLQAEAPGAVLDDHTRWRQPLVKAAGRLRALGIVSIVLIAAAMGAMITLAAQAALAANERSSACCVWWARGMITSRGRLSGASHCGHSSAQGRECSSA